MLLKLTFITLFCITVNGQGYFANKTSFTYNPEGLLSKILAGNDTQPRRVIKFEDQLNSNYISFDDQDNTTPVKFDIGQETNNLNTYPNNDDGATNVKFDNFGQEIAQSGNIPSNNGIQSHNGKKKRRRRKPKHQLPRQPGFLNPAYIGPNRPIAGPGQNFGHNTGPGQNFGPFPGPDQNFGPIPEPGQNLGPYPYQPEFHGQFYRPPRRPQPSIASDALSAVTGALTSIAHNDDYQCVPRLLCEAAAGGALGSSSLLESVSGLQPLLTLLSAYNGISSNPLFVFGRAAFLGVSSKENPGSCRYAYPLCPADPEQLVHYLNNHNGGFFRFFNAPQHGQQNLEQFYNQLSQNYGLLQPNPGSNQEFYGLLNPGMYQNPAGPPNLYPNGNGYQQSYGFAYPYNENNNGNGIRFKNYKDYDDDKKKVNKDENKIEKRIQNKPARFLNDNYDETNSKWLFPHEDEDDKDLSVNGVRYINGDDFGFIDTRKGKTLKFPDADLAYYKDTTQHNRNPVNFYNSETIRIPKAIVFPESQRLVNDYNTNTYYKPTYSNNNNYQFNHINERITNNYKGDTYSTSNNNNYNNDSDEPGVTTVYVVRGNGDPSNPEIVKLRPGESL